LTSEIGSLWICMCLQLCSVLIIYTHQTSGRDEGVKNLSHLSSRKRLSKWLNIRRRKWHCRIHTLYLSQLISSNFFFLFHLLSWCFSGTFKIIFKMTMSSRASSDVLKCFHFSHIKNQRQRTMNGKMNIKALQWFF
jgi:hypothetical protein